MKAIATVRAACLVVMSIALTTSTLAASTKELDARMSADGLQKTSVKGVDLAYVRPGATLAAYRRVRLEPIEVAFSKSWNPTRTGSSLKLSADERESIRTGVATLVQEEFARELQASGRYQIVNESAPDVLRVKAAVVNLYVNAPDTKSAARSRTIVSSAGEMTLVAELSDSVTGQMLARVADRRVANNSRMQLTNSVVNASEARAIAATWAKTLRKALDNAQGIGAR